METRRDLEAYRKALAGCKNAKPPEPGITKRECAMADLLKPLNGGPRVIDARMRFAERAMSDPPAEPTTATVFIAWPWFQIRRRYAYVERQRALGRDMKVYTSLLLRDAEKLGGLGNVKRIKGGD